VSGAHYGEGDLVRRVAGALALTHPGPGPVPWAELAPLDQFHVRGLAATRDLAAEFGLPEGDAVLDVGCGLGGPARCLASLHHWRVTGVDLSLPFIEVARMLAERTGLAGRVRFLQADALELPFPDGAFDGAWTQHAAMNIADRDRLYRGIRRVLKPGGRLAVCDVVAGGGGPAHFPVPWARTAGDSFLLTAEAMREALGRAGFVPVSWADKTEEAVAWFAQRDRQAPQGPLGLQVVMGDGFPEMSANFARNLREGRTGIVQAVLRSPVVSMIKAPPAKGG